MGLSLRIGSKRYFLTMKAIFAIGCLLLGVACTEEPVSIIPSECQEHVNEFFRHAGEKGLLISPQSLKIYYTTFGDLRQANSTPSEFIIRVDTSSLYWKTNPEALLFHELGHVYLNRDHENKLIGMLPKSIMHADQMPAYGKSLFTVYPPENREYYIDELFDPKTKPVWNSRLRQCP